MDSKDIKKYKFRGIYFYQDSLTYEEDQRVMNIITQTIGSVPKLQEEYAKAVSILYENGKIPELLNIVLKRDDRNIFKKIINKISDRNNLSDTIVLSLKQHEIMIVLTDFFLLKERWSIHFENYISKSVSKLKKKMMKKEGKEITT